LEFINTDKTVAASRKHIKTSIKNCWGKLDEYYKILDTLPIYGAALALNSAQKLAFIKTK